MRCRDLSFLCAAAVALALVSPFANAGGPLFIDEPSMRPVAWPNGVPVKVYVDLGALGVLVPGGAGSGAILQQVISALLFFAPAGVDPLAQLQGILDGPGGIGSVLELLGLGDLLGGILG